MGPPPRPSAPGEVLATFPVNQLDDGYHAKGVGGRTATKDIRRVPMLDAHRAMDTASVPPPSLPHASASRSTRRRRSSGTPRKPASKACGFEAATLSLLVELVRDIHKVVVGNALIRDFDAAADVRDDALFPRGHEVLTPAERHADKDGVRHSEPPNDDVETAAHEFHVRDRVLPSFGSSNAMYGSGAKRCGAEHHGTRPE